ALLNNQPMGFYHPFTILTDAQRHGLKVKPIDIQHSDWVCTLEEVVVVGRPPRAAAGPLAGADFQREGAEMSSGASSPACKPAFQPASRRQGALSREAGTNAGSQAGLLAPHGKALRLGFRYVKGLRQQAAEAIVRARQSRPFADIADLVRRVPELHKDEIGTLAEVGALISMGAGARRDALWQVERAAQPAGPLLEELPEQEPASPLHRMSPPERLKADFHGMGLTTGPPPMAYRRAEMNPYPVL